MLSWCDKDVHSFCSLALSPTRMFEGRDSPLNPVFDRYAPTVSLGFFCVSCVFIVSRLALRCGTLLNVLSSSSSSSSLGCADHSAELEVEPQEDADSGCRRRSEKASDALWRLCQREPAPRKRRRSSKSCKGGTREEAADRGPGEL